MKDAGQILERLNEIEKRAREEREEALRPAKERLAQIEEERARLDQEEQKLLKILQELGGGHASPRRKRRSSGRRMTSLHKKEVVAEFIREGHIRSGMQLSKELRAALIDRGFGNHDFRKLPEYMPHGWRADSNGMRGNAAKTVFQKI